MQSLVSVSTSELQGFVDAKEQLLQQSEELLLAIASIPNTPRNLLEILVNSSFEQVAELVDDILRSRWGKMGKEAKH